VIRSWADEHGIPYESVVRRIERVKAGGHGGWAVHASAFEVVVANILGPEAFADAQIDRAAVNAMAERGPILEGGPGGGGVQDVGGGVEGRGIADEGNGDDVNDVHDTDPGQDSLQQDTDQDGHQDGDQNVDDDLASGSGRRSAVGQTASLTLERAMENIRRVESGNLKGFGSLLDVIQIVTGTTNPSKTWADMKDVITIKFAIVTFKFPGQGQRATPVASKNALMGVVWECPGLIAREFRRQCASLIGLIFEEEKVLAEPENGRDGSSGDGSGGDDEVKDEWHDFTSMLVTGINDRRPESQRGVLYAVTSNLLGGIKVGLWRGTHTKLLSRYRSQYGADLEMITCPSENVHVAEREAFEEGLHLHISHELYRKEKHCIRQCIMRCATRYPPQGECPGDIDQSCESMMQARLRWDLATTENNQSVQRRESGVSTSAWREWDQQPPPSLDRAAHMEIEMAKIQAYDQKEKEKARQKSLMSALERGLITSEQYMSAHT
jgi:hypothetical protein